MEVMDKNNCDQTANEGEQKNCIELNCSTCDKSFSTIDTYIKHHKSHEKDPNEKVKYSCNLCSYSSTVMDHVRKHLMRHYDVKPFQCKICEWSCVTKHQLVRHKINHHFNLKRSRYVR